METARIPAQDGQQVQNALDHLAKHHLIVRTENDGSVNGGSYYLYDKDPSVRANRQKLIRFADDRSAADKEPTKRRPLVRGLTVIKTMTRQTLRKKKKLQVLYLTANADTANSLRVDAEVRQVQEAVRGSAFRDNISVEFRPAADLKNLSVNNKLTTNVEKAMVWRDHGRNQQACAIVGSDGRSVGYCRSLGS